MHVLEDLILMPTAVRHAVSHLWLILGMQEETKYVSIVGKLVQDLGSNLGF
jgi:hypothetical protein